MRRCGRTATSCCTSAHSLLRISLAVGRCYTAAKVIKKNERRPDVHIIFTACRLHYKGRQQPACAIFTTQNTCQSHVGQPRCGPHVPFRSAERHVLRCQTGRFALPNGTNAAALWPVARQPLATAYRTARCHPVSKPYFFTVNIFHVFLFSLSLHTIKLHSED